MALAADYSLSRYLNSYTGPVALLSDVEETATQDFKLNGSNVLVTDDVSEDTVADWLTAQSSASGTARVGRLYDHSGNANHTPIQTGTDMPTLIQGDINGLACLSFNDAQSPWLDLNDLLTLGQYTALLTVAVDDNSELRLAIGSSTANGRLYIGVDTGGWYFRSGASAASPAGTVPADTVATLLDLRHDGTAISGRADKTEIYTATDSGTGTPANLTLGAFSQGASSPWDGRIFEVRLYSNALNDTDRNTQADDLIAQVGGAVSVPAYSSGATLGSDGAYDVGTWTNTPTSYSVVAVNAAGDLLGGSPVTGATGTIDISEEAGSTVYLLVRASNAGGFGTGDFGSRTSGFGSSDDGYYEVASVTAGASDNINSVTLRRRRAS